MNEIAAMIGGEVEHIIPNPRGEFEELRKSSDCSKAKAVLGVGAEGQGLRGHPRHN